jgi:excisionase family DNA binding protein
MVDNFSNLMSSQPNVLERTTVRCQRAGEQRGEERMQPIAYSIAETCRVSGIGRTNIYGLIKAGALRARKHGKRTLVLHDDLRAFLEGLPDPTADQAQPSSRRRHSTRPVREEA